MPVTDRKSPGQTVVDMFGGINETARLLGAAPSSVWRWVQPRPRGTDGKVPSRWHDKLLALAKRQRRRLTAADLVHGRAQ